MRRLLLALSASFGLAAASSTTPLAAETTPESSEAEICEGCETLLDMALSHPRREADRARDAYRNPAETLAFFKVKPGMTVVDYMPASGWYTRILVPYLGTDGRYIGLNPDPAPANSERFTAYAGGLRESFPAKAAEWNLQGASVEAYNTDGLPEELDGTVDRVLIFREMHNIHRNGLLHNEFSRLHDLLKDDGLLGIVQHRAKVDAPAEYVDGGKGYMRQKDIVGLVEAYGFELVDSSEVNANAKDTADYPGGVWTLPPSLRGDEASRARYEEIGESDRMTLVFRKRS